jgi:hypothetical protein
MALHQLNLGYLCTYQKVLKHLHPMLMIKSSTRLGLPMLDPSYVVTYHLALAVGWEGGSCQVGLGFPSDLPHHSACHPSGHPQVHQQVGEGFCLGGKGFNFRGQVQS